MRNFVSDTYRYWATTLRTERDRCTDHPDAVVLREVFHDAQKRLWAEYERMREKEMQLVLDKRPSQEYPPEGEIILVRRPGGYDVIMGESYKYVAKDLVAWWAILPPLDK